MEFLGWVLIVAGLSTIGLVMYRWDWLMKSDRMRFMVKVLKEPGARIFYAIVAIALMALGFPLVTGWW